MPQCIHSEKFPCCQCVANRRWNEAATGKKLNEKEFADIYVSVKVWPNHWTEEEAAGDVDPRRCIHGLPLNVFCGKCES